MSQENVELARRGFRAFQAGEFTEMLGFLDPNIEVIPPKEAPGLARVYHGHEGFLEHLSQWFEPWDEYSGVGRGTLGSRSRLTVPFR
jgi:ketosteroid isomerase-like protein